MKFGIKKIVLLLIASFVLLGFLGKNFAYGDDQSTIPECQQLNLTKTQCVDHFTQQKSDLGKQDNTTTNQISLMTNQINLTQSKIDATQEQITSLTLDIDTATKKITSLQGALETSISVLINRIVATYEVGTIQPVQILLTSSTASDFFTRLNYLKLAQTHDKKLIYDTQQAKTDYANQKAILEGEKQQIEVLQKQLQVYTDQLSQEKIAQQQSLIRIKQKEVVNDSMLARAQADLTALATFAESVGISLIPHQDLSDGWGKYYNQRDSQWGNQLLNNDSSNCRGGPCTLARVGCLLTSYTMVVSHYGGSIAPSDAATNPSNFAGTADFALPGPSANGHPASDVRYPSLDDLRTHVRNGNAVIAGLSYDGGPVADHWVVLRSVNDDGSFMINDPLYEGAMNRPLNEHYSGLAIVEARIYN
jgi:peptidoglycan hydrolase CwlO-like protein